MFNIVYAGAEVPSHRLLLVNNGVEHVGFSFRRMQRRGMPKTKDYLFSGRFEDNLKVWVDSGISTADEMTLTELEDLAADYQDFVVNNFEQSHVVLEMDALELGRDWIEHQRDVFWSNVPNFVPIWHPEYGLDNLNELAAKYPMVALPGSALDDMPTLTARINLLAAQQGTRFHVLAMAKPEVLRSMRVASVSTLAWLSPMMRGETVVWDGAKLLRFHKDAKDQVRRRYRSLWERHGFNVDLIEMDDPSEVARATLWAYQNLEKAINKRQNSHLTVIDGGTNDELADNSDDEQLPDSMETSLVDADNKTEVASNFPRGRSASDTKILPTMTVGMREVAENGVIKDVPIVQSSGATLRQCDTCFVAANCPAFKPGAECAFRLPVELRTKEQYQALMQAIIEMQTARVMFARYSEELNGGYPDQVVSKEMDRLLKLIRDQKDIEENKDFMRVTIERQTSGGVLSQIFGQRASSLQELPAGGLDEKETDQIIDGLITDEDDS